MYYQSLPITTLIKDPKKIQKMVKKGKKFTIFSRSKPIFNIVPVKKPEQNFNDILKDLAEEESVQEIAQMNDENYKDWWNQEVKKNLKDNSHE